MPLSLTAQSVDLTLAEKQWVADHPTVYYGYDPGWQPIEFMNDGEHAGISADFCKLLAGRTGLQLAPHPDIDTWQKSMDLYNKGEVSILTCVAENEERSKIMNFTTTYLSHSFVIVTAKDGQFVGSVEDLVDKKVVAPEGYFITSQLEKEKKLSLTYTQGVKESMMKISTGEADATVGNIAVVSYYLNYEGFENLKIAAPTDYNDMELKMGVQKADTILLSILNKGLKSISVKERNEITQNWVSVTYEHGVNMTRVWTIAGISAGIVTTIFAVIFYWNRKLKKEIALRKEAELKLQKSFEKISVQKILIEEKNEEVLDSIKYAKRLQDAIMPSIEDINASIPKNFVLYKPKDIVAGDFYWMEKLSGDEATNEVIFLAAADCTGHGVPGALVSVVCSNALNRSVLEYGLLDPGQILDKTTDLVIERFSKSDENVKDGMDIGLSRIDFTDNGGATVKFSGAHNHMWIITKRRELNIETRKTEVEGCDYVLHEVKATKQPVGLFDHRKPFQTWEVKLEQSDRFYLYSDGFADQFGGLQGKKLKNKSFKKLLLDNVGIDITLQKIVLEKAFNEWKSDFEQLDDVCVIGVEI